MSISQRLSSGSRHSYSHNTVPSGKSRLTAHSATDSASSRTDGSASRGSWYDQTMPASVSSKLPKLPPDFKINLPWSAFTTRAHNCADQNGILANTFISEEESRHLWSIRSRFSRDELSFIACAESFGIHEALRFNWPHRKPLRELLKCRRQISVQIRIVALST